VLEALSRVATRRIQVWAIDSCPEFLALARRSWTTRAPLTTLLVDLASPAPQAIAGLYRRLDSLIAINVLQDLDLEKSLAMFAAWLRPGGRLRVTVLAKETMDTVYRDHPLYDRTTGRYYKPLTTCVALGRRIVGETTFPYERVLQYHTVCDARQAFAKAGLHVIEERRIAFPAEDMIARWQETGTLAWFPREALDHLRVAGVYVDAHELSALCTR
jgi:hypothetical protein